MNLQAILNLKYLIYVITFEEFRDLLRKGKPGSLTSLCPSERVNVKTVLSQHLHRLKSKSA